MKEGFSPCMAKPGRNASPNQIRQVPRVPCRRHGFTRAILAAAFFAISVCGPALAHAQGCSLCRNTTAGSAPHQREAIRRAILILGIPAGAIFLGILVIARRIKPREDPDPTNQP